MATIDLNLVRAFVTVHEAGSFSAAASRLGVPRSTVSRAVSALEDSLGVLLFHRTTRKVATTAAGLALFDRVAPPLATLDASLSDLPDREEEPSGTLRVTTTGDLGTAVLAEVVTRFTARYPDTQVEVHLSTDVVDLIRTGFDLALRISRGSLGDSSLIARKVGMVLFQLYASPSYLARRGTPRTPADLSERDWVAFRGAPALQLSTAKSKSIVAARARDLRRHVLCPGSAEDGWRHRCAAEVHRRRRSDRRCARTRTASLGGSGRYRVPGASEPPPRPAQGDRVP
jgi:DNA-binding transcriptional LysR family regulator